METNEFQRRLLILKGTTSLNSFANKCGIPYSTMRGYIEDNANPTLDNAKKIAAACDVTVAWLAGEEDDEWTRTKNRGLTIDRHIEIGEDLKQISFLLSALLSEFGHAYPEIGQRSRATMQLVAAEKAIQKVRHFAEENLFDEHKNDPRCNHDIYYGKVFAEQKRDPEKKVGNSGGA